MKEDKSLDILGIKPIGNAVEKTTEKSLDGASAFLSRICLPAAEEFGLLLQDKVKNWRAKNTEKVLHQAEEILKSKNTQEVKAHPLIVWKTLENASWCSNDELQSMWSGLLASSCDEKGEDDSNLIFINLLAQLTNTQSKIINYGCENSSFALNTLNLVVSKPYEITLEELQKITNIISIEQLDRELDTLRHLGLLNILTGGIDTERHIAEISPSDLSIQLYAKCQGFLGDTKDFYTINV